MKQHMLAAFGCVAVGLTAQTGKADYVGLVTIIEPLGASPAGPRDVYRVYAEFTNPTDRVDSWFGDAQDPLAIQTVLADGSTPGTGFTNFGGTGGILAPKVPGTIRDWDTYATIGVLTGDEAPFGVDATAENGLPSFI